MRCAARRIPPWLFAVINGKYMQVSSTKLIALRELVEVEALGMAHEVRDGRGVFGHHDERRMAGETVAQPRQTAAHARAQQQRRRIDRACPKHHDLRVDLVFAGLPRRGIALARRRLGGNPRAETFLADVSTSQRVITSTPFRSARGNCTRSVPCLAWLGQPRLQRLEPRQPLARISHRTYSKKPLPLA